VSVTVVHIFSNDIIFGILLVDDELIITDYSLQ
jgi:hypothetical protein